MPTEATRQKQEIQYALAKQVPCLLRGFRINTNYGDIVIEDQASAEFIAKAVQVVLENQLKRMQSC